MSSYMKHGTPEHIANEVRFLTALSGSGYVPRALDSGPTWLEMEHIDADPVTDADAFLVECCGALRALAKAGIVHGDLTDRNIIVHGNRPIMIDFSESQWAADPKVPKRAEGDAYWLWQAYIGLTGDPRRHARRWLAIRERLKAAEDILETIQRISVADVGCNRGDMVLMALTEGHRAFGVERDASIPVSGATVVQLDAFQVTLNPSKPDAVLLLSVLPYLLQEHTETEVVGWLERLHWRRLYVECQLYGDGPGPQMFRTKADITNWFGHFGAVTELVSIPIPDRGVERTTFEVAR